MTPDDGDDLLVGSDGNDTITGGPGDDTIVGVKGNNVLTGGAGNSTIYGGSGADTGSAAPDSDPPNPAMIALAVSGGAKNGVCRHRPTKRRGVRLHTSIRRSGIMSRSAKCAGTR